MAVDGRVVEEPHVACRHDAPQPVHNGRIRCPTLMHDKSEHDGARPDSQREQSDPEHELTPRVHVGAGRSEAGPLCAARREHGPEALLPAGRVVGVPGGIKDGAPEDAPEDGLGERRGRACRRRRGRGASRRGRSSGNFKLI